MKNLTLSGSLILFSAITLNPAFAHEYTAGMKAKKYAEVERAVLSKLQTEPNYAPALITKIDLILVEGNDMRLDEAAKLAETCIANNPDQSECHESLGNVLGTKAMKGGVMSALSYIGKIRDSFIKAVELDPKNYSARSSLLSYYLQAPGFVGGGKAKAQSLVSETAKVNPAAASLLQASIDLSDEKYAQAETAAVNANISGSDSLSDMQRGILNSLGHISIEQKKFAEGDRIFRDISKRYPEHADGQFGLGKSLQQQGKPKEALVHLENALKIEENARTYYRLGQCWQQLQEKTKAIGAYEKHSLLKPRN